MEKYIENNIPLQSLTTPPKDLLVSALEKIVTATPPLEKYVDKHLGGLFSGYTGLAYLFLRLAVMYPDIRIQGELPLVWTKRYLEGDRGELEIVEGKCGIGSEKLSYEAMKACVSGETADVQIFLDNFPSLTTGPLSVKDGDIYPSEVAFGRAGALYLLRMVEHWVPDSRLLIEPVTKKVVERILETDDDGRGNWEWKGRRYLGACHGDIGTITQIVLSTPTIAPKLADKLEEILGFQYDSGNWPASEECVKVGRKAFLVQYCHGAPGFIFSLQSIRPYFPNLHDKIDAAITKAQEDIWAWNFDKRT